MPVCGEGWLVVGSLSSVQLCIYQSIHVVNRLTVWGDQDREGKLTTLHVSSVQYTSCILARQRERHELE